MKRFKNYGLWVAIASLVLLLLQSSGVDIAADKYNEIINAVLPILVMAGILNNPSNGTGYKDN